MWIQKHLPDLANSMSQSRHKPYIRRDRPSRSGDSAKWDRPAWRTKGDRTRYVPRTLTGLDHLGMRYRFIDSGFGSVLRYGSIVAIAMLSVARLIAGPGPLGAIVWFSALPALFLIATSLRGSISTKFESDAIEKRHRITTALPHVFQLTLYMTWLIWLTGAFNINDAILAAVASLQIGVIVLAKRPDKSLANNQP